MSEELYKIAKLPKGIGARIVITKELPPKADFCINVISWKELDIPKEEFEEYGFEIIEIQKGKSSYSRLARAIEVVNKRKVYQYRIYIDTFSFSCDKETWKIEEDVTRILEEANPNVKFMVEVKKCRKRIVRKKIDIPEKEMLKLINRLEKK